MSDYEESLDQLLTAPGSTPEADVETIRQACHWAIEAHLGQVRKDGCTIIEHVVAVTTNVMQFAPPDPELVVAALLHDIVENTEVPLDEVRGRFGERVAGLVDAVTNRPDEDAAASAERAAAAGRDALYLRLCDRLDGVRRSPGRGEKGRRKFLDASCAVHLALAEQHFPALAEAMRSALRQAEGA
ncbi:MAG TPA: HD domain-containing protein, partial [Armatimonadota bacterium]|nr:HD domain-containing protein [Armatimonadota bacterium]